MSLGRRQQPRPVMRDNTALDTVPTGNNSPARFFHGFPCCLDASASGAPERTDNALPQGWPPLPATPLRTLARDPVLRDGSKGPPFYVRSECIRIGSANCLVAVKRSCAEASASSCTSGIEQGSGQASPSAETSSQ